MKVVLFCGGLGTRIREYSENIPKPMIPVGHQPILWHVMNYYSQYGHRDFVLCLGYKANVIKEFFLNYKPQIFADCVVSKQGANVELLSEIKEDWRVTLIDTGIWRNIGQRLCGGARLRQGRGDLPRQLQRRPHERASRRDGRARSRRAARSAASWRSGRRSPITSPTSTRMATCEEFRTSDRSEIWINGGYFIFRREIFDYIKEGEELVLEPFTRLIAEDQLMAYKHEGFWRSMDTLHDRQILEDMVEQGNMPWRVQPMRPRAGAAAVDVARAQEAKA